jgi:hypothetical protein
VHRDLSAYVVVEQTALSSAPSQTLSWVVGDFLVVPSPVVAMVVVPRALQVFASASHTHWFSSWHCCHFFRMRPAGSNFCATTTQLGLVVAFPVVVAGLRVVVAASSVVTSSVVEDCSVVGLSVVLSVVATAVVLTQAWHLAGQRSREKLRRSGSVEVQNLL